MFERVYTVWNYCNGPREGIADYRGQPHHYLCEWDDESDDYGDSFTLCAVDSETMELALEQWEIWRTWKGDFHAGTVPHATHPAFGGKDARYNWLKATLTARFAGIPRPSNSVRAIFRPADAAATTSVPGEQRTLEVAWEDVERAPAEKKPCA